MKAPPKPLEPPLSRRPRRRPSSARKRTPTRRLPIVEAIATFGLRDQQPQVGRTRFRLYNSYRFGAASALYEEKRPPRWGNESFTLVKALQLRKSLCRRPPTSALAAF